MRKFLLNENHKSRKFPIFLGKLAVAKLVSCVTFTALKIQRFWHAQKQSQGHQTIDRLEEKHRQNLVLMPVSNPIHVNERARNPSFNPLYAFNCLAAACYLVGCRSSLVLIHLLNLSCAGSNYLDI